MTYSPGGDVTKGVIPPDKSKTIYRPPTDKPKMKNKEKKMSIIQRIIGAAKAQNAKNSPFKRNK